MAFSKNSNKSGLEQCIVLSMSFNRDLTIRARASPVGANFRPVPDGGIDFQGIDPEGAVAVCLDHLPVRHRQSCRDGERHPDAEAAEDTRVHVSRRPEPGTAFLYTASVMLLTRRIARS